MKGFTLVELLVSIGIIGVIIGISTFGYRDFTRRQNVTASAKQIVADLRLAQQYALSGFKPSGCTGTLERVEFTKVSSSSYRLQVKCNNSVNTITVKDVPVTQGVSLGDFSTIGFLPVSGKTNLSSDVTMQIGGSGTQLIQTITIKPSGDIKYE